MFLFFETVLVNREHAQGAMAQPQRRNIGLLAVYLPQGMVAKSMELSGQRLIHLLNAYVAFISRR